MSRVSYGDMRDYSMKYQIRSKHKDFEMSEYIKHKKNKYDQLVY